MSLNTAIRTYRSFDKLPHLKQVYQRAQPFGQRSPSYLVKSFYGFADFSTPGYFSNDVFGEDDLVGHLRIDVDQLAPPRPGKFQFENEVTKAGLYTINVLPFLWNNLSINGKLIPITQRGNFQSLQVARLPLGYQKIEYEFRPPEAVENLFVLSFIGLGASVLFGVYLTLRGLRP